MLKKFIIIMFYLYYIFKEKIDTLEALQQIQKKMTMYIGHSVVNHFKPEDTYHLEITIKRTN